MNIVHYYQSSAWRKTFRVLAISGLFCCFLISVRVIVFKEGMYLFLIWNLFLAALPLVFSFILKYYEDVFPKVAWVQILLFNFWLLFFPNAPYIITDLVHLAEGRPAPLWYDASLLFCAAFTGLLSGLISLFIIHKIILKRIKKFTAWIIISILVILSGYGIYLGRVLRWNSWDIFINTTELFNSIIQTLSLPSAIAMTFVFSIIQGLLYLIFYNLILKDDFDN